MPEPSSPYIPFNRKNNPSAYPKTNGTKKKKETYEQLELPINLVKKSKFKFDAGTSPNQQNKNIA